MKANSAAYAGRSSVLHKELENNNVVVGNRRSGSALTPYHLLSKVFVYQDYTPAAQALSRGQDE